MQLVNFWIKISGRPIKVLNFLTITRQASTKTLLSSLKNSLLQTNSLEKKSLRRIFVGQALKIAILTNLYKKTYKGKQLVQFKTRVGNQSKGEHNFHIFLIHQKQTTMSFPFAAVLSSFKTSGLNSQNQMCLNTKSTSFPSRRIITNKSEKLFALS